MSHRTRFLILATLLVQSVNAQLNLPYSGTDTTNTAYAFSITKTGSGGAGYFLVSNVNTTGQALWCETRGPGVGVYGYASKTTGTTTGLYGRTDSTSGRGVVGLATAASGVNYGGIFESFSATGYGLWAINSTGIGLRAQSSSGTALQVIGTSTFSGMATFSAAAPTAVIKATNASTSNASAGILGESTAASGNTYGVQGQTSSSTGRGVYGWASAATGVNYGVYGQTDSTTGFGVFGRAGASSGVTYGVYGQSSSTSGSGVYGWASASSGITYGVYGSSSSPNGYGVYGLNSNSGFAGYFNGTRSETGAAAKGVYISVNTGAAGAIGLQVAAGTKSAVVATSQGARAVYCEEAAENWFTDYGFGQTRNGRAVIQIDPLFAQTVNLSERYHVFIQPRGNAELYVTNFTPESFEVRVRAGDVNVEFSYRIVARRLGFENLRLEHAPWADEDPNLYPEKTGMKD